MGISDLKRRHSDVIVPEWKERKMAVDREILSVRNQVLQDIEFLRNGKKNLKSASFLSKRAKLMEEIRQEKNNLVEQWRQEERESIFNPIIRKRMVLEEIENEGLFRRVELKPV